VLLCLAAFRSVLQYVLVRFRVLQCIAVCTLEGLRKVIRMAHGIFVLQCVAVCCSVPVNLRKSGGSDSHGTRIYLCVAVCYSVLQCAAACCNVHL